MAGKPATKEKAITDPLQMSAKKQEEWRYRMCLAQRGNKKVKDELIAENIGLIYLVLKRFTNRGHDMEELFQIGAIGLMKAVERFDLTRNLAFSTYAVPMIMGEIKRFLRDDGMIHISRQVKDNARRIAMIREEFTKTQNHEPTIQELERATQLSAEDIMLAMESQAEVDSIYRPITASNGKEDGRGLTLEDQLEDHRISEEQMIDRITIQQLVQQLDEREQELVKLRYREEKTQSQVAEILGMNQVAVSRMEKKILLHLREELTSEGHSPS